MVSELSNVSKFDYGGFILHSIFSLFVLTLGTELS